MEKVNLVKVHLRKKNKTWAVFLKNQLTGEVRWGEARQREDEMNERATWREKPSGIR